ncbi:hypothetical protein ScPMuIL_010659 [Solemya velum]
MKIYTASLYTRHDLRMKVTETHGLETKMTIRYGYAVKMKPHEGLVTMFSLPFALFCAWIWVFDPNHQLSRFLFTYIVTVFGYIFDTFYEKKNGKTSLKIVHKAIVKYIWPFVLMDFSVRFLSNDSMEFDEIHVFNLGNNTYYLLQKRTVILMYSLKTFLYYVYSHDNENDPPFMLPGCTEHVSGLIFLVALVYLFVSLELLNVDRLIPFLHTREFNDTSTKQKQEAEVTFFETFLREATEFLQCIESYLNMETEQGFNISMAVLHRNNLSGLLSVYLIQCNSAYGHSECSLEDVDISSADCTEPLPDVELSVHRVRQKLLDINRYGDSNFILLISHVSTSKEVQFCDPSLINVVMLTWGISLIYNCVHKKRKRHPKAECGFVSPQKFTHPPFANLNSRSNSRMENDVFLCCCDEDSDKLVTLCIVALLESWGRAVFLHSRDSLPGQLIMESYLSPIHKCKKIILLVSQNSLRAQIGNRLQLNYILQRIHEREANEQDLLVLKIEQCEIQDFFIRSKGEIQIHDWTSTKTHQEQILELRGWLMGSKINSTQLTVTENVNVSLNVSGNIGVV